MSAALHQDHDPLLVLASMLVASLAGFAALDLSARVAANEGRRRLRWIAASAVAMGVGIWSMHFVAMLAMEIGVPVVYDIPLLVVSILIAISASAITFTGAATTVQTSRLALASLAMGPAIAGMHYTGMASMRMPARVEYDTGVVVLSVVIAISASFAALVLARHFRREVRRDGLMKALASILMGAAVYGMHYTGMLAARFVPAPLTDVGPGVIATRGLGWAIAAGATVVIVLAVHAGITDRRVSAAEDVALEASRQHARMVETLQQIGQSLTSELDLQKVVQSVTDAGTRLTGAQFGAVFYNRLNEAGEAYTLYTISGVPREAFSRFPVPRVTPVFAPTFHGAGVVRSDDITRDPRYGTLAPHHGMPAGHLPVRSYLAVPIISRKQKVLGGLFFGHEAVGVFEARHEQLAEGIAGWAAVAMDNASLFEAQQRARAEAERANRAKSDFLAVMSHELRTPLNAVIGYTDLMLLGIDSSPDESRQRLERIGLSAQHLLDLIDEVLTFSRLDSGKLTVNAQTLDAGAILAEVDALIVPAAQRKGIRFECRKPPETQELQTDPRALRQILLNLASNAVKFTQHGSVVVELERHGPEAVFHVTDTGMGIAPDHQEKIFDAFWQVDTGSTRSSGGTGLGLSVSRSLARLLGGDLAVSSTPGHGSTFTLRLPLVAPSAVGGDATEPAPTADADPAAAFGA